MLQYIVLDVTFINRFVFFTIYELSLLESCVTSGLRLTEMTIWIVPLWLWCCFLQIAIYRMIRFLRLFVLVCVDCWLDLACMDSFRSGVCIMLSWTVMFRFTF